jgi:hypothetical protein
VGEEVEVGEERVVPEVVGKGREEGGMAVKGRVVQGVVAKAEEVPEVVPHLWR